MSSPSLRFALSVLRSVHGRPDERTTRDFLASPAGAALMCGQARLLHAVPDLPVLSVRGQGMAMLVSGMSFMREDASPLSPSDLDGLSKFGPVRALGSLVDAASLALLESAVRQGLNPMLLRGPRERAAWNAMKGAVSGLVRGEMPQRAGRPRERAAWNAMKGAVSGLVRGEMPQRAGRPPDAWEDVLRPLPRPCRAALVLLPAPALALLGMDRAGLPADLARAAWPEHLAAALEAAPDGLPQDLPEDVRAAFEQARPPIP